MMRRLLFDAQLKRVVAVLTIGSVPSPPLFIELAGRRHHVDILGYKSWLLE